MVIDLNCDVGEGFGAWRMGPDEELVPLVSSASVACGFHAGDPATMHATVRLARQHGVAVGAHPSYPDLAGFGRRPLAATPEQIRDDVIYQVGALLGFCRAEGVRLAHVKAHGALYNAAARDPAVARALAEAVHAVDPELWVVALARSAMVEAAREAGLRCAQEVFADRACLRDGTLLPRDRPGAVLTEPAAVADRVVSVVRDGELPAADGGMLVVDAQTVCIHGDTPGAALLLAAVRERLAREGIEVRAFSG